MARTDFSARTALRGCTMRDDAARRRERARVAARGQAAAPPGPAALEREVAALRAEVALLRATPCGNADATPCCACQLARAAYTIMDLQDAG